MKMKRMKSIEVEEEYFVCDICGGEFEKDDWCSRHIFSDHVGYDDKDEFGQVVLRHNDHIYYIHNDGRLMKFEQYSDAYDSFPRGSSARPIDRDLWVKDKNAILTSIVRQVRHILDMQAGIDAVDKSLGIHPTNTIEAAILDMLR